MWNNFIFKSIKRTKNLVILNLICKHHATIFIMAVFIFIMSDPLWDACGTRRHERMQLIILKNLAKSLIKHHLLAKKRTVPLQFQRLYFRFWGCDFVIFQIMDWSIFKKLVTLVCFVINRIVIIKKKTLRFIWLLLLGYSR